MSGTPSTVTITFRAKRDDSYQLGAAYKVPKLNSNHVSFSNRDTVATLIKSTRDPEMFVRQIERFYGITIPNLVWEDSTDHELKRDSSGWTIRPRGNGFMADVSISATLLAKEDRA